MGLIGKRDFDRCGNACEFWTGDLGPMTKQVGVKAPIFSGRLAGDFIDGVGKAAWFAHGGSLVEKRKIVKRRPPRLKITPDVAALLRWYDRHRRTLPWRAAAGEKSDPYRVWLSEIMLQQTTVATVGPYYRKFLARWPTLGTLAVAEEDDVLRLWAGLGYYRRARLLLRCARYVCDSLGGVFPSDEETLRGLPGFGPYTAAALAAIAFDKPANVVDGNVERVMARIFSVHAPLPGVKPALRAYAAYLVPQKRCGDYAQALMDLGATICTPRAPKCDFCPWKKACLARSVGIEETLPQREKRKPKPVRRAIAFVFRNKDGAVFLRRRPSEGLLGGMLEVPSTPWEVGPMPALSCSLAYAPSRKVKWKRCPGLVSHIFSHFKLEVEVYVGGIRHRSTGDWMLPQEMDGEALPSLIKKIVRHGVNAL